MQKECSDAQGVSLMHEELRSPIYTRQGFCILFECTPARAVKYFLSPKQASFKPKRTTTANSHGTLATAVAAGTLKGPAHGARPQRQ